MGNRPCYFVGKKERTTKNIGGLFLKELELIDIFCEYLDEKGLEYKREVRKGSYHNEGYIDIVFLSKEGNLCGVEAKVNGFQNVFWQASGNRCLCYYNFILYPRLPRNLEKLEEYGGIGLFILVDNKIKLIRNPERSKYVNRGRLEKMWRNWRENRCGRYFTAKEIPPHYTKEMISALEPTYEWVKKPDGELK
jgi:hypothetical protein